MKWFGRELKFNGFDLYHKGNKPTASEIGAASTSHLHDDRYYTEAQINTSITPGLNVARGNLGVPSVTEMALIDGEATNKMWFFPIKNMLFEESNDGITFTEKFISEDYKSKLVSGKSNSSISIPKGNFLRITFTAYTYVFLNWLYLYCSTNGNKIYIKCERQDFKTLKWQNQFDYTNGVSNWPGHIFIPHLNIPFATNGHYNKVRITIKTDPTTNTTGNPNYDNFHLNGLEWWGGYPSGKRTIYDWDAYQNVTYPAQLKATELYEGTDRVYSPINKPIASDILFTDGKNFQQKLDEGTLKGIQGEKGLKGDTGLQGIQGEIGPKGDTGSRGVAGQRGIDGIQGEKGLKGDTGLQGEKGLKGDKGAQGNTGLKGDKGDRGLTGVSGVTTHLPVLDTRNINSQPSESSFRKNALSADFKFRSAINNAPGSGSYNGLVSFAPWSETSGGNGYQLSFGYTGEVPRLGIRTANLSSTSWTDWFEIYHSGHKPTWDDVEEKPDVITMDNMIKDVMNLPASYLYAKIDVELQVTGAGEHIPSLDTLNNNAFTKQSDNSYMCNKSGIYNLVFNIGSSTIAGATESMPPLTISITVNGSYVASSKHNAANIGSMYYNATASVPIKKDDRVVFIVESVSGGTFNLKSTITNISVNRIFALCDKRTSQYNVKENFLKLIDINTNNLIFGMIADVHYTSGRRNEINSFANWRDVMEEIEGLDFGFLGGDIVNGDDGKKATIKDLKDIAEVLSQSKVPVCYTKGNHDHANHSRPASANDLVNDEETYNAITKYLIPNNAVGEKDTNYFYVDYEKQKIRCIFLDTIDVGYINLNKNYEYGMRQKQLDFLIGALKLKGKSNRNEWAVATFSHMPFNKAASYIGDGQIGNGLVAEGILNAFKNGTSYSKSETTIGDFNIKINCDFSKYGTGNHITHFYGHTHADNAMTIGGIRYVCILNGQCYKDTSTGMGAVYNRVLDSSTENAFDIVEIDRANKKIKCHRFGAGQNRVISY